MGVVHMNGRIYDPLVGRFMSADPFIQAPSMLQSYNRYAYVMNNPLNLTDPSGYFSLRRHLRNPFRDFNNHGDRVGGAILGLPFGSKGYHAVFNFLQGSGGYQVKSAVISVLSIFCGYGAAACNGGGQAGLAKAYGASDWDAFNTGGQAALSTGLFQWAGTVGGSGAEGANSYARYFAHAGAGCVSAAAGGGNCGQGAASAVFGKFATNAIDATPGEFNAYDAAATVVAGGVGSVIAGGKFETGAMTAAYGYLYNNVFSKITKPGQLCGPEMSCGGGGGGGGGGRSGALNDAKRDLQIPRSQHPDSIESKAMTDRNGNNVLNVNGERTMTREYTYTRPDGSKVLIQDHSAGHSWPSGRGNQGSHFNVRPPENPRTGNVLGTKEHYSW
jgi:HNH/Endo VII superfamily nuclease toxins